MKKTAILFTIILICNYCTKKQDIEPEETSLLMRLNQVTALNKTDLYTNYIDKCLTPNPFGIVSEKVTESFSEFNKSFNSDKIKHDNLKDDLINNLYAKLPGELTQLSQEGYTEVEGRIYSLISESLANDDYETYMIRILLIEDLVVNSFQINEFSKDRILIYTAALKSIITFIHGMSIQTKLAETWEECFIRKQRDMGFFESLACVASWPICLGAMAADCIIETAI